MKCKYRISKQSKLTTAKFTNIREYRKTERHQAKNSQNVLERGYVLKCRNLLFNYYITYIDS